MTDIYSYVEGKLYNYKAMKVELNSYKIDLEYLNKDYEGCRGKAYTGIVSRTNNFYSSVETELVKREEQKELLELKIKKKELQIKRIEYALTLLNDEELELVKLRYFSNEAKPPSWVKIGKILNSSGKRCRHLRDRIVYKIANLI